MDSYQKYQTEEWEVFENSRSYSNARLPQALLRSGIRFADSELEAVGLQALNWLVSVQRSGVNGHFVPIGSEGFYSKKTEKARFDQQPIEACAMVSACVEAYRTTGQSRRRPHG